MARFFPIVLLLLPFVWRSGLAIARLAVRDERHARFLTPAFGIALWLLSAHIAGLITHGFFPGLFIGTVAAAIPGALTFWRPVAAGPLEKTPRQLFLGAFLMTALFAWPQLQWQEHDEAEPFGHVGISQVIEAGGYPPHYPWFPAYEIRYHYGVDLATAMVSAMLGHADMSKTLHGLTIALWGYAFCLFWLLGEEWFGGVLGGAAAGTMSLLAGGFELACRGWNPISLLLMGDCFPTGNWIDPPFLSNFLQHPWALATPLAAAVMLVFTRRRPADWRWFGGMWLLLVALSLAQFAVFAAFLAAVCAAGCLEGLKPKLGLTWRFAALGALVVLVVTRLHGFMARGTEPSGEHFGIQPFWTTHPFGEWLAWNVQSIAFLLPFGILGAVIFKRERFLLGSLGFGGIFFGNLFSDGNALLKLTTVAELTLGLLSAGAIVWLLRRSRRWQVLGGVGWVLCTLFSLCFAFALGANLPGLWFTKDLLPPPTPPDQQAIDYLRLQHDYDHLVFRAPTPQGTPKNYTLYGGLPEPYFDWNVFTHGFTPKLIDDRNALLARPSANVEPYLAQGFRWFVLSPDDKDLSKYMAAWTLAGKAQLRAEFPPLKVYSIGE